MSGFTIRVHEGRTLSSIALSNSSLERTVSPKSVVNKAIRQDNEKKYSPKYGRTSSPSSSSSLFRNAELEEIRSPRDP
ncbi:hypothetical protein WG66_010571 [Moniliophthora roreri]|nr:hypothetical protein WG66_010571 [Moniliophthora roreri]